MWSSFFALTITGDINDFVLNWQFHFIQQIKIKTKFLTSLKAEEWQTTFWNWVFCGIFLYKKMPRTISRIKDDFRTALYSKQKNGLHGD